MGWVAERIALFTAVFLVLLAAALLAVYHTRRARIAAFARTVTRGSRSVEEAVFALARVLYVTLPRRTDPKFTSILALGASPVAVLRLGGCCAGIHRLFITALDAIGVSASTITVYRPGPDAAHRLAQVHLAEDSLIIDVDYGICYRRPDGRGVSLAELRAGVAPVLHSFMPEGSPLRVQGNYSCPPGRYPGGPYYAFDYRLTRTANWTVSRMRRLAYSVLYPLTDGRVDGLQLPPVLEWPEVLMAIICAAGAALLLALHTLGG